MNPPILRYDRPLTVERLVQLPDDGNIYEVILGELVLSPKRTTRHQRLLLEMFRLLDKAVKADAAGKIFIAPFEVQLSRHNIVKPDLILVGTDQKHLLTPHRFEGVPRLVIEVTTEESAPIDRIRKAALYEQVGVQEYWLVDTEYQANVIQQLTDGGPIAEFITTTNAWSCEVVSFVVTVPELFANAEAGNLALQ